VEREQTDADEATGSQAPVRHADLVLMVDDERSIAETLATVVEFAGYRALITRNGQQALASVQHQWPALVISDVMMPLMDGRKFVAALRVWAACWHLPMPALVLMTAASQHAVDGREVDAVALNPFDMTAIETFLHRFLGDAP
jgi:CheY-like chemotaxis protein